MGKLENYIESKARERVSNFKTFVVKHIRSTKFQSYLANLLRNVYESSLGSPEGWFVRFEDRATEDKELFALRVVAHAAYSKFSGKVPSRISHLLELDYSAAANNMVEGLVEFAVAKSESTVTEIDDYESYVQENYYSKVYDWVFLIVDFAGKYDEMLAWQPDQNSSELES